MRRVAWSLLPVALVAGFAVGYVVRGQRVRTTISTLVQIQTVAPPPPATKTLTATVTGPGGACLATNDVQYEPDTYTLRSPGNGLTSGSVLAVANGTSMDAQGCNLVVTFSVSPSLGFFDVVDEQQGESWGPFDSRALARYSYRLRLSVST